MVKISIMRHLSANRIPPVVARLHVETDGHVGEKMGELRGVRKHKRECGAILEEDQGDASSIARRIETSHG